MNHEKKDTARAPRSFAGRWMPLRWLTAAVAAIVVIPPAVQALVEEIAQEERSRSPLGPAIDSLLKNPDHPLLEHVALDRSELTSFYAERQHQPLWIRDGQVRRDAQRLLKALEEAGAEGLNPSAYPINALRSVLSGTHSAETLAAWDILMSQTLATYAIDLRQGRTKPAMVYTEASLRPPVLKTSQMLLRAAQAPSLTGYVTGLNQLNPIYNRLRDALARYREEAPRIDPLTLAEDQLLRHGDRSDLVIQLRERLGVPTTGGEPRLFDAEVEKAVRAFQRASRLEADGIIGPNTLKLMNASLSDRIGTLIANMERARWLPADMGERFALVDVAGFELKLFEGGKQVDSMKVVAGKEYHRTPMFADMMEYVVVNPYWNVPNSILVREIAPAVLQHGAGYIEGQRMEVLSDWGDNARVLPVSSVDWAAAARGEPAFRVRQKPGGRNALGRIKFMFPNKYNIYLHDTPADHLFEQSRRAYSHGCVRVERPVDLADFVFRGTPEWDGNRIQSRINSGEHQVIRLKSKIPVYLTYFTAWPRQDGTIAFRADPYERDEDLKAQLSSSESLLAHRHSPLLP